jgi:hypothetical protein
MKNLIAPPGGWKSFPETGGPMMNGTRKTVWMADLKKAGERVECLWSKSHRESSLLKSPKRSS